MSRCWEVLRVGFRVFKNTIGLRVGIPNGLDAVSMGCGKGARSGVESEFATDEMLYCRYG